VATIAFLVSLLVSLYIRFGRTRTARPITLISRRAVTTVLIVETTSDREITETQFRTPSAVVRGGEGSRPSWTQSTLFVRTNPLGDQALSVTCLALNSLHYVEELICPK
jgi:hypothetical protein